MSATEREIDQQPDAWLREDAVAARAGLDPDVPRQLTRSVILSS